MKYLDSAFVDKVRSDLRLRETKECFKTDYSLVKNEYVDDSPKKSGPTGRQTKTKKIKKEPKTTQRTKVNWSTSKPKRLAANTFSDDYFLKRNDILEEFYLKWLKSVIEIKKSA